MPSGAKASPTEEKEAEKLNTQAAEADFTRTGFL